MQAAQQADSTLTDTQIEVVTGLSLGVVGVGTGVLALLSLVVAAKIHRGRNWARVLLVLITAVQIGVLFLGPLDALSMLPVALNVLAVLLCFMPASQAHFAAGNGPR